MQRDPLTDLELLLKSRQGLVAIDTLEEERVLTLLRLLADRMTLPLFLWSRTKGLRRDGFDNAVYGTTDPAQALAHMAASTTHAIYHLSGAQLVLQDAGHAERLRELAAQLAQQSGAIILSGVGLQLPDALKEAQRAGPAHGREGERAARMGCEPHRIGELSPATNAKGAKSPTLTW